MHKKRLETQKSKQSDPALEPNFDPSLAEAAINSTFVAFREIDNPAVGQKKWGRFELDGVTPHQCPKKKEKEGGEQEATAASLDSGPQIAALAEQVKDLKETVNILISQIQSLRSEVKAKK